MSLFETIAPIFPIILVGYLVKTSRFLKNEFFVEANRFVYFFSLPVLIFTGTVKSGLQAFSPALILSVVVPTVAVCLFGCALGGIIGLRKGRLGRLCSPPTTET
jgi:predicted permease